jgi:hypothetical protein
MKFRRLALSFLLAGYLLPAALRAQQPLQAPSLQASEVQVLTPTLQPVGPINCAPVGSIGGGVANYWVVAKFPTGNAAPAGPCTITNAPNVLNGSNYVQLNWGPVTGATGYDVLKTATPSLPNTTASIALALAQAAVSYQDQGAATSNYNVNTTPGNQLGLDLLPPIINFLNYPVSSLPLSQSGRSILDCDTATNFCYLSINGGAYTAIGSGSSSGAFVPNPFSAAALSSGANGGDVYIGNGTAYSNIYAALALAPSTATLRIHVPADWCSSLNTTSNLLDATATSGVYQDPFENSFGIKISVLDLPACPAGQYLYTNSPLHTGNTSKIWGSGVGPQDINYGSGIRPGAGWTSMPVAPYTGAVTAQAFAAGSSNPYDATAPACPAGGSSLTSGTAYSVGLTWITPAQSTDLPLQPPAWQATTGYVVGLSDFVLDGNGNVERNVQAGTSGATAPTWITPQTQGVTVASATEAGSIATITATAALPGSFVVGAWVVVTGFPAGPAGYNVQGSQITAVTSTTFSYTASASGLGNYTGNNLQLAYTVTVDGTAIWVNMGTYYQTTATVTPTTVSGHVQCIAVQRPATVPTDATLFQGYLTSGGALPYFAALGANSVSAATSTTKSGLTIVSVGHGPPPGVNLSCALQVNGVQDESTQPLQQGAWNKDYILDAEGVGYSFQNWVIGAGCAAAENVSQEEGSGFFDVSFVNASGPAIYINEGFQTRSAESSETVSDLLPPMNCATRAGGCAFSSVPVWPTYAWVLDDQVEQVHAFFSKSTISPGDSTTPPLGVLMEEFYAPTHPASAGSTAMVEQDNLHEETVAFHASSFEAVPLGIQDDGMQAILKAINDNTPGNTTQNHVAITLNGAPASEIAATKIPPSSHSVAINDVANSCSSLPGANEALWLEKSAGTIAFDSEGTCASTATPTGLTPIVVTGGAVSIQNSGSTNMTGTQGSDSLVMSAGTVTVGTVVKAAPLCTDANGGATTVGCQAANTTSVTPYWLRFFGDGSEGALNVTTGTTNLAGEHWYSSVNISSGATVAVTFASHPLVIRSTGTCTIAGTISNSVNAGSGLGVTGIGDFGASGGGGSGGTAAGTAGSNANFNSFTLNSGGTAGAASGGNAGNGATPSSQTYKGLFSSGDPYPVGGSAGGAGGSSGGAGGKGGGAVILVCPTINWESTAVINVSGGNGGASTANNVGAGGGGGGGFAILSAQTYTTNAGTFTVTGGTGGSCGAFTGCGTAGNGGTGWDQVFTIQ